MFLNINPCWAVVPRNSWNQSHIMNVQQYLGKCVEILVLRRSWIDVGSCLVFPYNAENREILLQEEGDQAKISPKKQNGANMLAFTRVLVRSPRAADLCRSRIAGSDMPAACCSDLSTRNASLVKFTPCFAFHPKRREFAWVQLQCRSRNEPRISGGRQGRGCVSRCA
jgi:hypothetical protein